MPYFDPVGGGFYSDDRNDIPPGSRKIREELRTALINSGLPITADEHGMPVAVRPAQPEPQEVLEKLLNNLDRAADQARLAVVGDPLRALEYETAAAEAARFKSTGYPDDEVPRSVMAGAINGISARESADSILREAQRFSDAQYLIREARLQGKATVRDLVSAGQLDQAREVANGAIQSIAKTAQEVGHAAE